MYCELILIYEFFRICLLFTIFKHFLVYDIIMKRIFVMLVLSIIVLKVSSQNRLVKIYYDEENKKKLKEAYFVSDTDSTLKQGDYKLFSIGGNEILSGKYDSGKKSGIWIERSLLGKIESYGSYNKYEAFTGVKFIYDINNKLERIQYLLNDEFNPNPFDYQSELIIGLNKKIEARKDESDFAISSELEKIVEKYNFYNSLDFKDEKFPVGDQLLLLQIKFLENSNITFSLKEKVSDIKDKLAQIKNSKFNLSFTDKIITLEDSLLSFKNAKKIISKNEIAYEIIYLSKTLDYFFGTIQDIDNKIESIYTNVFTEEVNNMPEFIRNKFSIINKQYEAYTNSKSIESKIRIGNDLLPKIEEALLAYKELSSVENVINEKFEHTQTKYKNQYNILHEAIFSELEKNYRQYQVSERMKDKIATGSSLLKKLDYLDSLFIIFTEFDEQIDDNFKNIRDNYLSSYPAIYKNKLPILEVQKINYNNETTLEKKLLIGNELSNKLNELSENLQTIRKNDKLIYEDFPKVRVSYKSNYRKIYKTEIIPLSNKISQYKHITKLSLKLDFGKKLCEKIIFIKENYDNIDIQEKEIKTKLPVIKQSFKERYPDICKFEIKKLEDSFKTYLKVYEIGKRIDRGSNILLQIEKFSISFDTITEQIDTINTRFNQCDIKFKKDFPVISKNELQEFKSQFKDYNKIPSIKNKLNEGERIIAGLDKMLAQYDALYEIHLKLAPSYDLVNKNYMEYFSVLHKSQVVPLRKTRKAFAQSGYIEKKIKIGNELMIKLEILNEKYNFLKTLSNSIKDKNTEFVLKYKNDFQSKYIYKRGKKLYASLLSTFESEANIDKKSMLGEELESILTNLNSISPENILLINEKLKDARSIEEIKSVLNY